MANIDPSCELLAAQHIRKQAGALAKQLRGARKARDIECVHQGRVASRRLRVVLRMFGDCFDGKPAKRWRRSIRRVTKGLGPARDLDVQIDFVRQCLEAVNDKAVRPGVRRLLLRLRQQREALQPKVLKALDRLEASGVLKEMQTAARAAESRLKRAAVSVRSPVVFLRAERLILRRLEELLIYRDCLNRPEDKLRHHEMRIAAKRLRYTMEVCRDAYEGEMDEPVKAAKRLQTLLGDIHDCDVWDEVLPAFLQAERERTAAYFGHAGSFGRLQAGVEYLRKDRRILREQLFAAVRDYWGNLEQAGLWDKLISTVLSRVQHLAEPQAAPPEAPADSAAQAAGPAAAEPPECQADGPQSLAATARPRPPALAAGELRADYLPAPAPPAPRAPRLAGPCA